MRAEMRQLEIICSHPLPPPQQGSKEVHTGQKVKLGGGGERGGVKLDRVRQIRGGGEERKGRRPNARGNAPIRD